MTDEKRQELSQEYPEQRFDSSGEKLSPGCKVKVVIPDPFRKGKKKYSFCEKGKVGVVVEGNIHDLTSHFFILVRFGNKEVGCLDYHLKKID